MSRSKLIKHKAVDSFKEYNSAVNIIDDLRSWINSSVDCFDGLSSEQRAHLLRDIIQMKVTLHLFERLIVAENHTQNNTKKE